MTAQTDRASRTSCENTPGCSNTCYQSSYQPAGTWTDGWCADWDSMGIDGQTHFIGDDSTTQADCFITCDNTPGCTQAVFETGGEWANECWLGTMLMSDPVDTDPRPSCADTADCSNSCYESAYKPTGTITAGWCAEWDSQGVFDLAGVRVRDPSSVSTEAECFIACDTTPGCTQAVFETGGEWGEQVMPSIHPSHLPERALSPRVLRDRIRSLALVASVLLVYPPHRCVHRCIHPVLR